jgi:hypothetical protein
LITRQPPHPWTPRAVATSLMMLTALLLFGREACADCAPTTAAAGRTAGPAHIIESLPSITARVACGRDSTSHFIASHPIGMAPAANALSAIQSSRWSLASVRSAEQIASRPQRDVELETPVQQSLSGVHWADSHDWVHNPPEWLKAAKNYRRQGMPILHLMQSQDKSTLLALGISNHGKPGLYLTRKLPY